MRKIGIVSSLLEALDAGETAEVAIVVATEGSAPRSAGAWMAVLADGSCVGTVGGGALENRIIEDARTLLKASQSRLVRYTIGGAKSDTGMVCGGSVELLLVHIEERHRTVLQQEADILARRGEGVLAIDLAPFGGPLPRGEHGEEAARSIDGAPALAIEFPSSQAALKAGIYKNRYVEPICPEGRAFVIGCGHVGRALVETLGFTGFATVACDDRPEMLEPELLPRAAERLLVDYDNLAASLSVTPRDLVVVCTAGHGSDFEVLTQVLPQHPAYLGCLGSKKKTAHTKARLQEAGFAPKDIDAIRMPIGVPMACETPEEIAISIAAQMIDLRRTKLLPRK